MTFSIRPAREADIPDLARLLLMATDGVVASLYEGVIPGVATAKIVERRLAREGTTGAYANCWVAVDGTATDGTATEGPQGAPIAGKLHAYPLDDLAGEPPDPLVPEERYKVLEAFDALDEAAAGSYYINVIAVYPEFRRRGLGARLLDFAGAEAERRGLSQLSLAVFEENEAAVRLYRRLGFAVAARAPAPAHPLIPFSGDMLMMMRAV